MSPRGTFFRSEPYRALSLLWFIHRKRVLEESSGDFTAEYMRSRMMLEPETQRFVWLLHPGSENGHRAWDRQWAGKLVKRQIVNDPQTTGRKSCIIRFMGKYYGEHRLMWLFMTGEWPVEEIDHRNGDSLDNRFENLREAAHGQNQTNKGPMRNNRLGVKGVYQKSNGNGWTSPRYTAQIAIPGVVPKRVRHLGTFDTIEEASAAYQKVAAELHGEFLHSSQKT